MHREVSAARIIKECLVDAIREASKTLCRSVAYRIGGTGWGTGRRCGTRLPLTTWYFVVDSVPFVSHVHADGYRRRVNMGYVLSRLISGKGQLLRDPTARWVLFFRRVVTGIRVREIRAASDMDDATSISFVWLKSHFRVHLAAFSGAHSDGVSGCQ